MLIWCQYLLFALKYLCYIVYTVLLLLCVFSGATAIFETIQGPDGSGTIWTKRNLGRIEGTKSALELTSHWDQQNTRPNGVSPAPGESVPGLLSEIAANLFSVVEFLF